MQQRRRFKQTQTLVERLAAEARRLREKALRCPGHAEQEQDLAKARELEMVVQMDGYLRSRDLQRPS